MRTLAILVTVTAALLVSPATAKSTSADKPPSCTAQWNAMSDTDKKATTRKAFMASCKTAAAPAATMAAPASTMAPAAATPSTASQIRMAKCAAGWNAMSADQKKATTYKDYSKTCLSGGSAAMAPAAPMKPAPMAARPAKPVSAPAMGAMGAAPAGATGLCKDGTYTMSKTHSGSCSHHGGVAKWL